MRLASRSSLGRLHRPGPGLGPRDCRPTGRGGRSQTIGTPGQPQQAHRDSDRWRERQR